MASDWIKMRADLFTHPKVDRLAVLLGQDEFYVVGALFAFWSWADKHAVDGRVDGATSRLVDRVTRVDGLASALEAVGWLVVDDAGIALPRFHEHNGDSAKERSLKNQRQARWRERKAAGLVDGLVDAKPSTGASTREEKRREEYKSSIERKAPSPSRFDDFWAVYPNKKGKVAAEKAWKRKGLDLIADQIIADVKERAAMDRQWLDGFIPHGSTYVNAEGWQDAIEAPRKQAASGYVPLPGEF